MSDKTKMFSADENTYTDTIFQYLTDPQNYYSAMDLVENMSQVDQRLRDEFWEQVTSILHAKLNVLQRSSFQYLQFLSNYEGIKCEWFEIRNSDWKFYYISTDGEDIGIRIMEEKIFSLKSYEQIIKEEIDHFKKETGGYQNMVWVCWKKFHNYRFQTKIEKVGILPCNRENTIADCANTIFIYLEHIIKVCDIINKKIKELIQE